LPFLPVTICTEPFHLRRAARCHCNFYLPHGHYRAAHRRFTAADSPATSPPLISPPFTVRYRHTYRYCLCDLPLPCTRRYCLRHAYSARTPDCAFTGYALQRRYRRTTRYARKLPRLSHLPLYCAYLAFSATTTFSAARDFCRRRRTCALHCHNFPALLLRCCHSRGGPISARDACTHLTTATSLRILSVSTTTLLAPPRCHLPICVLEHLFCTAGATTHTSHLARTLLPHTTFHLPPA